MNWIVTAFSLGLILVWLVFLLRMLMTLRRFPPPRRLRDELQRDLPFVSILVPARDEARNIGRCIRSLLDLDYPHYEIVAVDDRSSDDTLPLLRELEAHTTRLRVVSIEKCPEGWTGKNHALHVGVRHARGTWLLFTDADTIHSPTSLRLAIQEARKHSTGFLSFFSRIDCRSFGEGMIQPLASALVSLWHPIEKVNDRSSHRVFANGQYILTDRNTYEAIGGHSAVRGRLPEDVALAERARAAGIPIRLAIGTHVVRTRMYRGFRESWRGWERIFRHLPEQNPRRLLGTAAGVVCIGSGPLLTLLVALALRTPLAVVIPAALAFLLSVAVSAVFNVLSGQPSWPAVFLPLSTCIIPAILSTSAWRMWKGKPTVWRGVSYARGQG